LVQKIITMKSTRSNTNALASLRKRLGLSQEQMAIKLNVHRSTIKFVEQGKRTLPTNSLILLANLEIMLGDDVPRQQFPDPHPAETASLDVFRKKYEALFARETICCVTISKLSAKLENTLSLYQQSRERLQIIETAIIENETDEQIVKMWQRQQTLVTNSLDSCGLPMQVLLRTRIAILTAEAAMYKTLKEQLAKDLPVFFFEGNH
jgi:transcriptional regulator with XRE-family HTH domain